MDNKDNQLKSYYDLIPSKGISEVNKVFNSKLNKFDKHLWKKGLQWRDVLSSLEKHLNNFKNGIDFSSPDILSIAEVASNALILSEYYSTYPQGDDRESVTRSRPIIGLDLDNVIFNFNDAYEKKFEVTMNPFWKAGYQLSSDLEKLKEDKDFWINLEVLNSPDFEVDYYITARNIDSSWTQESIQKNNLPCAPVYTVGLDESKLDVIKKLKIDIMVDDKYETFRELNSNGVFCYLMNAPHNSGYDVGHRRIYDLKKISELCK